jgi:ribosomal protein S18 acetylase RimI-like enzyme
MVLLEVRPSNVEALGLYESLGFRVVGRRHGYYYDTGEDALVMEATVVPVEPRRTETPQEPRAKGTWG